MKLLFFGNRRAWGRVGCVSAAMAAMLAYATCRWETPHPCMWDCLHDPVHYDGATVWIGPAEVTSTDAEGFTAVQMRDLPARVKAATGTVAVHEQVVFRGTFRRAGYVDLDVENGRPALRLSSAGMQKRYGMFILSFGVMGYLAWRWFRAFRIRGGQIHLKI